MATSILCTKLFKGPRQDLRSKFKILVFHFLMFRIVNIGIFNDSSKFECQILRYKQAT